MSDFAVERGQDSLGLLGTVVAKHRLLRVIGDGGMGTVYVGKHEIIGELHAIKVCKLTVNGLKERATSEARMMAKLNHPGICKLYDVELGPPDGTSPVMVMELLNGHPFFDEIAAGAIAWPRAVQVAIDVLDALEQAHCQGIVHRDIKPENVFIARRPDGQMVTKVMDFGIGKLAEVSTTQTGTQMGTPHYMSPEQATNAKGVDARTDIYSVGAMLYRCVTGSYLFPRDSAVRVIAGHLNDSPEPVRSLAPNVPDSLAAIIHRALAKSREQRFASAAAMRDALRRCLAEGHSRLSPTAPTGQPTDSSSQPTLSRRRTSAARIAVVAAVFVIAAGICVAFALRARPSPAISAGAAAPRESLVTDKAAPPAAPAATEPATALSPIAVGTAATTPVRPAHRKLLGVPATSAPGPAPTKKEPEAPSTNGVIKGIFDD